MSILQGIFRKHRDDNPEPVIIREIDPDSAEYKEDPWQAPWETEDFYPTDSDSKI